MVSCAQDLVCSRAFKWLVLSWKVSSSTYFARHPGLAVDASAPCACTSQDDVALGKNDATNLDSRGATCLIKDAVSMIMQSV
eukprot:1255879-Amphidinium_carterae.1